MGVSFDSYKTFYYVAKFRSFTEAARALYVTQPTVTHAIQMLEKRTGLHPFPAFPQGRIPDSGSGDAV